MTRIKITMLKKAYLFTWKKGSIYTLLVVFPISQSAILVYLYQMKYIFKNVTARFIAAQNVDGLFHT